MFRSLLPFHRAIERTENDADLVKRRTRPYLNEEAKKLVLKKLNDVPFSETGSVPISSLGAP